MPNYQAYFKLSTTTKPLLTAASYIGSTPAAIVFAPITNKIGRKKAMMLSACIKLVGVV